MGKGGRRERTREKNVRRSQPDVIGFEVDEMGAMSQGLEVASRSWGKPKK